MMMLMNQSVKYCKPHKKDKLLFSTLFCFLFQGTISMKCRSIFFFFLNKQQKKNNILMCCLLNLALEW